MKKLLLGALAVLGACAPFKPLVRMPEYVCASHSFQELVDVHVKQMLEMGYAQELSRKDLFHAHAYILKEKKKFSSLRSYQKNIALILYHTREDSLRAFSSSLSRNIVGFPDGSIKPIEELVDVTDKKNFVDDLLYDNYVEQRTYQSFLLPLVVDSLKMESPHIGMYTYDSQFYILSDGMVDFRRLKD
ncbi:MAG: hypothetical protein KC535_02615 [Nanoarchaeota archaeon]|nr:hypothetical protein [Nanoarchaeota archaeon]